MRILFLTLIALIVVFIWTVRSTYRAPAPGVEVGLNELERLATDGRIQSATLLDEDAVVVGTRCQGSLSPPCPGRVEEFHTSYPDSDVSTQQLIDTIGARAPVTVDKQTGKTIAKIVITFIFPLVLLANLFGIIFMWKGGDNSMADIAGFGAIGRKRKRERRSSTEITFADVAGADEAITELREVTSYLTNPEEFEAYGAAAPKGVLLFGSPGCGKTLLARAVAGESNVPFFSVSGAEFVESLVGVGAARVRDLFRQVREVAPAIVFIDEIDAVGRKRGGEGMTGGEREQTVNQLLVEMDGFDVSAGIVLMGATNRPDILDAALMRPGRFDRHITLEPPDINGRREILELHARKRPIAPDVDFEFLARRTPGFSGADLANVINEAALLAIREGNGGQVQIGHLTEAIQRVMHGPQRRGKIMSPEERQRIAFHEAGHAVVAAAFGRQGDVPRVSIVARGRGLGQSVVAEESDRVLLTAAEIEAQIAMAMGGLAAEELFFGGSSTTAEDDIERATELAKEMAGLYGMSPEIGRVRLLSKFDGYLGAESAPVESVSPETMRSFDEEVKRLIDTGEERAKQVLDQQRRVLERMAGQLQEDETLEGTALESVLADVELRLDLFSSDGGSNGARKMANGARKAHAASRPRTRA